MYKCRKRNEFIDSSSSSEDEVIHDTINETRQIQIVHATNAPTATMSDSSQTALIALNISAPIISGSLVHKINNEAGKNPDLEKTLNIDNATMPVLSMNSKIHCLKTKGVSLNISPVKSSNNLPSIEEVDEKVKSNPQTAIEEKSNYERVKPELNICSRPRRTTAARRWVNSLNIICINNI